MKTREQVAANLDDSEFWRLREIETLRQLSVDSESGAKIVLHRSLVLLLYAHLEGFSKEALGEYLSYIASKRIPCFEALPVLASFTLKEEFKHLTDVNAGSKHLPHFLKNEFDLRRLAIEAMFVCNASMLGQKYVEFNIGYIDTENNVDEKVLKKNLFRLGLDYDQFKAQTVAFRRLKDLRNKIGHGENDQFRDDQEASQMITLVRDAIEGLKKSVLRAIDDELFRKGSATDCFAKTTQN